MIETFGYLAKMVIGDCKRFEFLARKLNQSRIIYDILDLHKKEVFHDLKKCKSSIDIGNPLKYDSQ